MFVASATRPRLVEHLAQGLGRILDRPIVGEIRPKTGSEPGRHEVGSALRLAGIESAYPAVEAGSEAPATPDQLARVAGLVAATWRW